MPLETKILFTYCFHEFLIPNLKDFALLHFLLLCVSISNVFLSSTSSVKFERQRFRGAKGNCIAFDKMTTAVIIILLTFLLYQKLCNLQYLKLGLYHYLIGIKSFSDAAPANIHSRGSFALKRIHGDVL